MAVKSGPPGQPAQDEPPPEQPRRIGKYDIQKKIGAGGMGAVYLALDTQLRRTVALKLLPREKAENPILVRRFQAEAQAAACLKHENIVMVYEAGEANGYFFIALEYIEGTDVADLVERRGVLPAKRSQDIVKQVARALQHASEQGIVHRDIKPANLLIRRDGTVKLADLGLARSLDEAADTGITRAGTTVGTVDYMSPEQARDSKAADVRSDIYSLGCTWYHMLSGQPPYPDGSLTNKLRSHAEAAVPDPRLKNPNVPEGMVAVLNRMMAKKPQDRYQTAAELIQDLQSSHLSGDAVAATILSDESEQAGNAPVVSNAAAAPVRTAKGPPPRESKRNATDSDESAKKERNLMPLVYAALAVAVIGVASGLGWLTKAFSTAIDSSGSPASNPFASRDDQLEVNTANQPAPGKGDAATGTGAASGKSSDPSVQAPGGPSKATLITGKTSAASPSPASTDGSVPAPGSSNAVLLTGKADPGTATSNSGHPERTSQGNPTSPTASLGPVGSPGPAALPGTVGVGTRTPAGSPGPASASGGAPTEAEIQRKRARLESLGLPLWAVEQSPTSHLPVLTVRTEGAGARQFETLNDALQHASAPGAVVVLTGTGPFVLRPASIANKGRLVIRSDATGAGSPPVIMLVPGEQSGEVPMQFSGTSLELSGVHLLVDSLSFKSGFPAALMQVTGGDVRARNCSFTVKGQPASPSCVFRLDGQVNSGDSRQRNETRLLLEKTVIRGHDLTALQTEQEFADLIFLDSLIVSGAAPAVRVVSPQRKQLRAVQRLRIVGSTVSARQTAFLLERTVEPAGEVAVSLVNSVVAAPSNATRGALVALQGWTAAKAGMELGRTLTWSSTSSLFLGWKTLMETRPEGGTLAVSFTEWAHHWRNKAAGEKDQFQLVNWPVESGKQSMDADLVRFSPPTIHKTPFVKTSDGHWPGCPIESLIVVDAEAATRPTEITSRPQIPPGLFDDGRPVPRTIRVDVTREDLGKAITGQNLPNGTLVVASGFGTRASSPIIVQNTWIRVHFEQTDGYPLIITPRLVETGRVPQSSHKDDAFISVVNGGIELVHGAFSIPSSERQILPVWFVHVTDGDLAMRQCRIQGPMLASRNKGLIHWGRTGQPAPTRPFEGDLEGYAAIQNCYLSGSGVLMEADVRRRGLFIRNSIGVSRDDGFRFSIGGVDSQIDGIVDLRRSTFSVPGNIFDVEAATLGAPCSSPLTFLVDRCVFATALKNGIKKPTPTLMAYKGPLLETKQLVWNENRNGYAADVTWFLRPSKETPAEPQSFTESWLEHWGPDHVLSPLTGVAGVFLKAELPARTKLEPSDFQLDSHSKAASWDGSDKPIGADLATMHLPETKAGTISPSKAKPVPRVRPAPIQGF